MSVIAGSKPHPRARSAPAPTAVGHRVWSDGPERADPFRTTSTIVEVYSSNSRDRAPHDGNGLHHRAATLHDRKSAARHCGRCRRSEISFTKYVLRKMSRGASKQFDEKPMLDRLGAGKPKMAVETSGEHTRLIEVKRPSHMLSRHPEVRAQRALKDAAEQLAAHPAGTSG